MTRTRVARQPDQSWAALWVRLVAAALSGWAVLAASEFVLFWGGLRLFAKVIGPELLPSLKVVLDMALLAACGWIAGRIGRPRVKTAATLAAAGLAAFDLTPYLLLNVPWLLRLAVNAVGDSRYFSSLLTTIAMHALMFGSLLFGAYLSRPSEPPIGLGVDR